MARIDGCGGGVGGLVLVEISLSLLHILPKALLLQLAIVGGGAQNISCCACDPGFIHFLRFMVEGGLGCLCNYLGT